LVTGADDDEAALRRLAPHFLVGRVIDAARRQLDHGDVRTQNAGEAVGGGGRGVEYWNPGDALAANFQIRVDWVEAIQRVCLDRGGRAEARDLAGQPVGAGLVTRRSG